MVDADPAKIIKHLFDTELVHALGAAEESQHVIEDDFDAIDAGGSWVGGFDFDWTEDA